MNSLRFEKEHLLDLLVDGELNEAERRELLLWCERDPEGWRRCALAFLEAQSWSKELAPFGAPRKVFGEPESAAGEPEASASWLFASALRSDEMEADASGSPENVASKNISATAGAAPRWRLIGWPLAMAASFLISFALGLWARSGWLHSSPGGAEPANANLLAKQELADRLRQGSLDRNLPAPQAPAALPRQALGPVRLVVDGPNGASDEIELPVVEGNTADADFWRSRPAAIPPDIERILGRMGHRVRQTRELLPLRMQDGRRLIVPVDQVEVHPVGNRAYQ